MMNPRGRGVSEDCGHFGGNLEDMPQPLVRLWPGARRKRVVTVRFVLYVGVGKHVYATVEEEDNPVWGGECWVKPWRDDDGRGVNHSECFFNHKDAGEWAQGIIDKHFPTNTHKPIRAGDDLYVERPRRWFYKDGD